MSALNLTNFRGLNTNVDRRYIEEDQFSEAINVEWNHQRFISSRPGAKVAAHGPLSALSISVESPGSPLIGTHVTKFIGTFSLGGFTYLILGSGSTVTRSSTGAGVSRLKPWYVSIGRTPAGYLREMSTTRFVAGRGVNFVEVGGSSPYLYCPGGHAIESTATISDWTLPASSPVNTFTQANLIAHKDRLFISNINSNRLYFSKVADPNTWANPDGGFIDVGVDEVYDDITGLVSIQDRVLIFKPNSIWVLFTNGTPSNWVLRKVDNVIGAYPNTVRKNKNLVYFYNQIGVFVTDGNSVEQINGDIASLWEPRSFLGRSVSTDAATAARGFQVAAETFDDKYLITVLDEEDQKRMFMYDMSIKAWVEWELELPGTISITDIFSYNQLTEKSWTNPEDIYNAGLYFTVRNTNWEGPILYHLNPFSLVDEYAKGFGECTVGSTTSAIKYSTFQGIVQAGDILRFVNETPSAGNAGVEQTVTSHNAGATTINVDPGFPEVPASGTDFVVYARQAYPISLKTKAIDLTEPGSIKKLRKAYVTAKVDEMTVTTKMENGDLVAVATVVDPTSGTADPKPRVVAPVAGNVRGNAFSFDIDVPSSEAIPFILYGISMHPSIKGESADDQRQSDSSS